LLFFSFYTNLTRQIMYFSQFILLLFLEIFSNTFFHSFAYFSDLLSFFVTLKFSFSVLVLDIV
jgi:hypothetical protein